MNEDLFDLTERPWIPCESGDGALIELGLGEVLLRAHELRAINDASPLVTAALHRFVLAVVHRVFGPPRLDAWRALFRAERFDEARVASYLRAWRHRLRLFDLERPFYQVRGLPFEADDVGRLVFERSNYGAAVSVFQHPVSEGDTISPREAARALLTMQLFAPGGTVHKPGEPISATAAPLNGGAMNLLTGRSVKETLLLNLPVYAPAEGLPVAGDERDAPAWERDPPVIAKRRPDGWLDLLTWQSRRLELRRTPNGQVCGVVYCVGQDLDDAGLLDPMLAYRRDDRRGWLPVEFREERAAWRDSHALMRASDPANVQPAACVRQLTRRELRAEVPRDRRLSLDLLGMRGDQAKIHFVRHERFPVSPALFEDAEVGRAIQEAIVFAERAMGALSESLRQLAESVLTAGQRSAARGDVRDLVEHLGVERDAWAALAAPFERFLRDVPSDVHAAYDAFAAATRRAALRAHAAAVRAVGSGARALRAAATTELALRRRLRELGSPREEASS